MPYLAVEQVSFEFVSDGLSLAFAQDLSLPPVLANFIGSPTQGLLNATVTTPNAGVTVPSFTAALVGNVLTLTFASVCPQYDVNSNVVIYTFSALVKL